MSSFLQKYKRQPKLFIDLPSQGKWYNDTIIQDGKVESMPVFGMTAMDEILLKTPDALFSGEATAQVIQSCIPNILDPWRLVGYDIDFVLIAIRIATYGETLPVVVECPKCTEKSDADVNLQNLLGLFANYEIELTFNMGELTFILHPITYRETTDFTIQAYTTERQLMQLDKLQLPQEERDKKINELLQSSAELNLRLAVAHLFAITDGKDEEDNKQSILEWMRDNDAEFYTSLRKAIGDLTERWKLPSFETKCGHEECGHVFKTNVDMDYSNFFGTRSLHSRTLIS